MVEAVQGLRAYGAGTGLNPVQPGSGGAGPINFARQLQDALARVNHLQHEADEAAIQFVTGELQDIHQLMIRTEEARLALQLTVQVTNKVIEAYQEMARLQF